VNTVPPKLESKRQPTQSLTFGQVDFSKPDQIVAFTEGRYEKRSEHRIGLERQWYMNIAHYLGYQYHTWDEASGRIAPTYAPSWRVRLVCNRLMPIVRKVVSKILRQRPTWNVIPATNDYEDQSKAIAARKALQYYWRYLDMDAILVKAFTWMSTTGNVFLRTYWDPTKGPEMEIDPMELMMLSPEEQKIAEGGIRLGDLCIEMATPFEVDPDPDCDCLEEARYLIHTKSVDIQYLKDTYGAKAKDISANSKSQDSLSRFYEKKIQSLQGAGTFSSGQREQSSDQVLCHSLWVNPTSKFPKGRYAVIAGQKLLHMADLPGGFKRIPYVHMQEIPVPGRFWGTCSLEQCIPLQQSYNRRRSQLIENSNLMSRPKWLLPKNSGVINTALDSRPGEVIEYNYGAKPEVIAPQVIPESSYKLMEYDLKDMEDVSAIHEVTQARAPSGVRSGVAIAQLQEQDDQMLAPTFLTAEKALSRIGSWALQLLAENVTEERLVKITGKENEMEAMSFLGADLIGPNKGKPGVNYFDVETQIGSQLPLSSAARKDFVLSLIQSGVFNAQDPNDRKKIFRVLELGTEETVINDSNLDRQQARRENLQLMQGQFVEPNPWDEDTIHIEEHRRYQKAPDYLKYADPNALQMFEAHIQGHELKMQLASFPQGAPQPSDPTQPMQPDFGQLPQEEPPPFPQLPDENQGF
jgi:hypothetical protein